jgi:hypothetical protein
LPIGLLVFIGSVFASGANAQSLGIGIYPPVLQIDTTPPASVKATINVANQTDQSATYNIFLEPFTAGNKYNGEPDFDSALISDYKNFFSKVQVFDGSHAVENITLAPKQKKSLTLHIGLAKNDKPQDYYFSVLFVSSVKDTGGGSVSSARGGVGTNVLVSVGPKQPAAGLIDSFKTSGFQSSGPVKFDLLVKNTGSSYFAPKGSVLIRDMFGKTVGQVSILPVNVLAGSKRLVPSSKNTTLTHPQVVWNQKFLLGFYTATATLSLSDQGPLVRKTTTFFAFPIEGILGILICLLIMVAIFKRVKAKRLETS